MDVNKIMKLMVLCIVVMVITSAIACAYDWESCDYAECTEACASYHENIACPQYYCPVIMEEHFGQSWREMCAIMPQYCIPTWIDCLAACQVTAEETFCPSYCYAWESENC